MAVFAPIPIEEIQSAHVRIAEAINRTPLVRLNLDNSSGEIYLKLENLQPIGSFKLRGASNALLQHVTAAGRLGDGVWTASAGNMAQGVAWQSQRMGIHCTAVVPEHAPETKLAALRRLGAAIVQVPFEEWFQILDTKSYQGMQGTFIHPSNDVAVMAGNGTIALEILEDLPDVNTVIIPFGSGGLSCGIASGFAALKPDTRIVACEVETGAPLAASLAAGTPQRISYKSSFVDGIGSPYVLPEMWPLAQQLLHESLVVSVDDVASAIKLLAERNHIIAEGAGAASVAAALSGNAGSGKIVCIISGGNIDLAVLAEILHQAG